MSAMPARVSPVALLLVLAWLTVGGGMVRAEDAPDFPSELVDFGPPSAVPLFAGAGPGAWDAAIRERGWIRREPSGTWRMWYTGYDDAASPLKRLGIATSPDGLNWSRAPVPAVPGAWVEDTCVVRGGAGYVMVAEGEGDVAWRLDSADGLVWRRRGPLDIRTVSGLPIPPGPRGTPTLWREGGRWWLFYERGDQGVWAATSTDLETFTNVSDEPVLALGPEAYDARMIALDQIVRHRGRYYAYYHSSAPGGKGRWCTCIARSDDLVHWTKYAGNPIVPVDEAHPATSSAILVPDGERHRLYTTHPEVRVRYSVLPVRGGVAGPVSAPRP